MNKQPEISNSGTEIIKVLLIEDNPDHILLIREMLSEVRNIQFKIECAERLSTGLKCLAEKEVDVVLLNLNLPDSQGLDTLDKLLNLAPETPILVLTNLDNETFAIKAVQEGAQDYLIKGQINSNLLVKSIHYAIERQRMQVELRQNIRHLCQIEERFRNIIEKNADGIVIVDRDGIVRFVNPASETLFGRKAEELIGTLFGFPVVADETAELDIVRRDGEVAVAEMRVVETEWDGETVYFASLRDITERKRAEDALQKSKEEFWELYDNAPVGYHQIDPEGNIVLVNRTEANLLGYAREEMLGCPIFDFVAEADREEAREAVRKKIAQDQPIQKFERTYVRKDGSEIQVAIEEQLVFDERGDVAGIRSALQDITERVRAEKEKEDLQAQLMQSQRMEAIGTLAGGVAHDFNNLLTIIQGYTNLVMMEIDETNPVYLDLIEVQQASMRAADLIRQLLLFSHRQPMDFTLMYVNNTVENLLKMLKRLIGEDIKVEIDLEPDLWTTQGDEGNIEQVIMNLVVNARDAMPEGGKLTIKTENVILDEDQCKVNHQAQPGKYVCLSVSDTGVGIDKEIIGRIFEPFFSTKEIRKGTGLGLSVVYGIVKEHEGWINVKSEPGLGSMFVVYLPAFFEEMEDEAEETISLQEVGGGGERILLVEDNEIVCKITTKMLVDNGYVVFEALNAEEALDIFERENGDFHLVFSDVVLPNKNAIQLVDKLLSRNPELRVLLSSGYTDGKSQLSVIRERGLPFIHKPYNLDDLLHAVREVIG